ncbi:hypothetical protein [Streptomyces sp. NPDC126503]|uniref:hypothetical protein n=1 Tax=Streptomyces sp. NPDC126503 TaxID=3155315 RepID=UPI00331B64C7
MGAALLTGRDTEPGRRGRPGVRGSGLPHRREHFDLAPWPLRRIMSGIVDDLEAAAPPPPNGGDAPVATPAGSRVCHRPRTAT